MRHSSLLIAAAFAVAACGDIKDFADAAGTDGAADPDAAEDLDAPGTPIDAPIDAPGDPTLTVVLGGSGGGTVTSSAGGINCPGTCTASLTAGTPVRLTATATATPLAAVSRFAGWSGGGCSGTGSCSVTLAASTTVTATFALEPNLVFVTTTTHNGNLGGIAGADAICQARAQAGGLSGTYRAWLSTSTSSALSRLGTASGWVRPDGKPVFDSRADLSAPRMFHPIRIDERGGDVGIVGVTTASYSDGTRDPNSSTCADWTSTTSATVTGGYSIGMAGVFSTWTVGNCSDPARLFCFGVDRAAAITITPPASYRRAFTTTVGWVPGGGLASADALCTSEASAAGLPGSYRAMLATTSASAASRFNLSGPPWGRPDGVLIAATAADFFSPTALWDSAPNTAANPAGIHFGNYGSWGGATAASVVGTAASTCASWTSTTGTGGAGRTGLTRMTDLFNSPPNNACNVGHIRLTCLQE